MKKGSVLLCTVFSAALLLALAGLQLFAPRITAAYADFRALNDTVSTVILVTFYLCSLPAAAALLSLLALLRGIRSENAFSKRSSALMSVVSWCCIAVAAATLWAGFSYPPFFLVTAAMLFLFLIVRIIRGCFVTATALKEDSSLTI